MRRPLAQPTTRKGSTPSSNGSNKMRPELVVLETTGRYDEHPTAAVIAAWGIRVHIEWLEKKFSPTDRDLEEAIEANAAFKENELLLRSVPAVGPVLARTLLTKVPELGMLTYKRLSALVGVAPFNNDSGQRRGKREV